MSLFAFASLEHYGFILVLDILFELNCNDDINIEMGMARWLSGNADWATATHTHALKEV